MADGPKQLLTKKSSSLRKTGSKSKILTAEDLAKNHETDRAGLSQQGSTPFLPSTRRSKNQVSNVQLKAPEVTGSTGESVPRTEEHLLMGKEDVKTPSESRGAPAAGDSPSLMGSERVKVKAGTSSVRSTQSALLVQSASKLHDSGASDVPSTIGSTGAPGITVPLGSKSAKSISGMSGKYIKSTLNTQSMSRPDVRAIPSTASTQQGPSSSVKSMLVSQKSLQTNASGQVASQITKTSLQGVILVPSDKSRKLTRASEAVKPWVWGSKQSVLSKAENIIGVRSSRKSIKSEAKSLQLGVPSGILAVRSSKTPGVEHNSKSSFQANPMSRSVSEAVLGSIKSSQSTLTDNLDENIRLLASKLSSAKLESRHELDLPVRMEMCPCPDVMSEHEDDEEEELALSCPSSIRSKQSKQYSQQNKRSIRNVKRSPFERKDRAARQEFLKELERMEISEIEKKQRLKPRRIKKHLKKEGVYQTIKDANLIPDSHADTSPRHSSAWSVATLGEKESAMSSSSSAVVSPEESEESERIDKIQLRGHHSVGSRAAAGLPLLREEAFLEVELSEAEDVEPAPRSSLSLSSSSATEALSSSSEISLRVNLDKAYSHADKKKIRARNAPFVLYKNKVDKEIEAAKKQVHDNTQENVIIEKIATEFGEWAKENGLKPEAVEKDIIKELFQFGTMDTAANSIAVEIKELIIVPETITEGLYPELEERAALYRQILWDEMAYWKKERSMAFGKPDPFPYKRPPNQPLPLWTKSGFVPLPLSTGELLYKSLIDNESLMLERYVLWMVENPKYHRPPYLIKSGYFQKIIDKHGGSEEVIRQKSNAAKHLVNATGKSLAGLNIGMKNELRKLKEMAKADLTVQIRATDRAK